MRILLLPFAAVALLAASLEGWAQALETLRPVPPARQYVLAPSTEVAAVVVKFHEGTGVRLRNQSLTTVQRGPRAIEDLRARALSAERVTADLETAGRLLGAAPGDPDQPLAPTFSSSEEQLARRRATGERRAGRRLADLALYVTQPLAPGTVFADVTETLAGLNGLASVELAYAEPVPLLPQADIPPPTGDFEPDQGYLNPAPEGVDARYAWSRPGGTGAGVRIIDVEIGWNTSHEDLPPLFFTDGTNQASGRNHGTAVLGVMVAADNGYGVTGISYGAQAGYASHAGDPSFADAINTAAGALEAGDIVIIEIHLIGPENGQACNPDTCGAAACDAIAVEYWQAMYDAIETATANGIVVVEAAGNGRSNYDDEAYGGLFDRDTRDSGAILVAAGTSDDHGPTCFTNWGDRIDVQGWGENVATLGYGSLFDGGGDEDQFYIPNFNGTSSASPVVAGAAASVQGAVLAAGRPPLTSVVMRDALRAGGTPQLPHSKNIGPLPNLRGAIDAALHPNCAPPAAGDWIVSQTCVVAEDTTTPANVEVRNSASLIVLPNAALGVGLATNRIRVRANSRLLVRPLGRVD